MAEAGAKLLEDGQERRVRTAGDDVEDGGERRSGGGGWDDALMLHESAPAVKPVPPLDAVEREEVGIPVHQERSSRLGGSAPEVDLIERRDGPAVEGSGWEVERHSQPSGPRRREWVRTQPERFDLRACRVFGGVDQRAAQGAA